MEIICSKCNKTNKLPDMMRTDGAYKCGFCSASLFIPGVQRGSSQRSRLKLSPSQRLGLWFGTWLSIFIFILAIWKFWPQDAGRYDHKKIFYALPAAYFANGVDIDPPSGENGPCSLQITNKTHQDAAVKLISARDGGGTVLYRFVYVRKGLKTTIRNIEFGNYGFQFALGTDWSPKSKSFNRDPSYYGYSVNLRFDTNSTTYNLVLGPAPNENSKSTAIPKGEFQQPIEEHKGT